MATTIDAEADPIGAAQAHLVVYAKAVADSIWEVQQLPQFDADKVATLGAQLLEIADEMDRRAVAIPNFPRDIEKTQSLLVELQTARDALEIPLRRAIARGGEAQASLASALRSATFTLGVITDEPTDGLAKTYVYS